MAQICWRFIGYFLCYFKLHRSLLLSSACSLCISLHIVRKCICNLNSLQTFVIPGALFLSILSGNLFGGVEGFIIVTLSATIGASMCFGLSSILGKSLVVRCMPRVIITLNKKIKAHRDNLFFFLLFLRITPLVPNLMVNVCSPILGVPILKFAGATFLGLIPLCIVHVRMGLILSEVNSIGGFNFYQLLGLLGLGFVSLIPVLLKKRA